MIDLMTSLTKVLKTRTIMSYSRNAKHPLHRHNLLEVLLVSLRTTKKPVDIPIESALRCFPMKKKIPIGFYKRMRDPGMATMTPVRLPDVGQAWILILRDMKKGYIRLMWHIPIGKVFRPPDEIIFRGTERSNQNPWPNKQERFFFYVLLLNVFKIENGETNNY